MSASYHERYFFFLTYLFCRAGLSLRTAQARPALASTPHAMLSDWKVLALSWLGEYLSHERVVYAE